MFQQDRFNLGGSHREAFVLDHFFAAVENIVKVLVVAADYIAGPVPSIPQHRRRRPRILPVPEHELWSAHDQFSALAGSNFLVVFVEYGSPFGPAVARWTPACTVPA